jgi:hypothetical protein
MMGSRRSEQRPRCGETEKARAVLRDRAGSAAAEGHGDQAKVRLMRTNGASAAAFVGGEASCRVI